MSLTLGTAAVLGGLAAAGSIGGSLFSAHATEKATKRQIRWERERAQNAHQWEVADLKTAGLNPILSAGGSGAVTGGISAPVPDSTGISGAGETIANTMLSALTAAKTSADTGLVGAQTENINADTQNKLAQNTYFVHQAINEELKSGLISAQTAKTKEEALLKQYENKMKETKFWLGAVESGTNSARNISQIAGDWIKFLPKQARDGIEKFTENQSKTIQL